MPEPTVPRRVCGFLNRIRPASGRGFTATITACYLLGLTLGLARGFLTGRDAQKRIAELQDIPGLMTDALSCGESAAELARELAGYGNFLYLGRGMQFAVALEGDLGAVR